ncbi:MAG: hypothetical protein AABW65_02085 [Nanoarchaeota archaeon]
MKITIKKIFLGFFFLASFLFLMNFASAASLEEGFAKFLNFLVGDYNTSSTEMFFVKFLVFILLLTIINAVIKTVPFFEDRNAVSVIVALAISLLGVRYLTSEALINFIWLPYGVLGITISSVLPFIIIFFLLQTWDYPLIRKVVWTSFLVIYGAIAYLRWDDLQISSLTTLHYEWYANYGWIYVAIALISFLLIIFDKQVHASFLARRLGKHSDRKKIVEAAEVNAEIEEKRKTLAKTSDKTVRKAILDEINELKEKVKDILKS